MMDVVISGTGLYAPPHSISNEELVTAYNAHADAYNAKNKAAIDARTLVAKPQSSAEFIEKASGIKSRYVIERTGIMDPDRMYSRLPEGAYGDDETPSIQADMAIRAAKGAIAAAGLEPADIDYVICSATVLQRYFPALGIEVQHFLGTSGAAMDMVMACSSATFGMITAVDAIRAGSATRVLMINPEIFSSMINFGDRDTHFIFGDVATAVVLEARDICTATEQWRVTNTKKFTEYSNNIRSNYGPLTRLDDGALFRDDMFFCQEGRKVFRELLPIVCRFVTEQLDDSDMTIEDLKRMWLHQANINMNMYAAKKLLGREPEPHEAPIVLDEFANTTGSGSIIAFHKYRDDLKPGDKGIICSFGAGYSVGSLIVERL